MRDYFLRTSRLGFSLWSDCDILEAIELWGNPKVTNYITATGIMSNEEICTRLTKEIETYKQFSIQYWPIFLIETNEHIGCCGLRPYNNENNILEMGIHLKDKYWGKGLAQEACSAVIKYAFCNLHVQSLFAGHNPKNAASAKMLTRLGFKYTHDEFYQPTGLYHPSYILSKDDYAT